MKLSVVAPIFNEQGNIRRLYESLRDVLNELGADFELIFVNDGSTDASADIVTDLHGGDARVKLLSLSRNFGHQAALTAGLDKASGDAVIMMDADMQHPPELIKELVARWKDGYEVVYTVRESARGPGPFKRLASAAFYGLFRRLSGLDLPANVADFRLLDKKVAAALRRFRERARFLRGLTKWAGYRSVAVAYHASPRHAGDSKYGFVRMARLAVDGVVSFSTVPLYVAIYVGIIEAALGFAYAAFAIVSRFVMKGVVSGWASVIVLLAVLSGIQLVLLGVIGLYIGKVFEEVKHRPIYLVRRSLGLGDELPDADREQAS